MISYSLLSQLRRAQGLDELLRLIKMAAAVDPSCIADIAKELPTFGGRSPQWTHGVLSWDRDRILIGTVAPFRIINRFEWAA